MSLERGVSECCQTKQEDNSDLVVDEAKCGARPSRTLKRKKKADLPAGNGHNDPADRLAVQLNRLRVSSLQNSKRRKKEQREFHDKIKRAVSEGRMRLRSITVVSSESSHSVVRTNTSHSNKPSGKNSIVLSNATSSEQSSVVLREHMMRHRHWSDSCSPSVVNGLPTSEPNAELSPSFSTRSLLDFSDLSKCCKTLESFSLVDQHPQQDEKYEINQKFSAMQERIHCQDDENDFEDSTCDSNDALIIPPPKHPMTNSSCSHEARYEYHDVSVNDLAGYLEDSIVFPKKMSAMAELMYT